MKAKPKRVTPDKSKYEKTVADKNGLSATVLKTAYYCYHYKKQGDYLILYHHYQITYEKPISVL